MQKSIQNQNGFTLVEMLTAIALSMILMAGISGVLSTSVRASNQSKIQMQLQQEARFAVDSIVRELQFANEVKIIGSKLVIYTNKYKKDNDKIEYYLNYGRLYRCSNSTVPQPVTGESNIRVEITELSFKDLNPKVESDKNHPGVWIHTIRSVGIIMEVKSHDNMTNRDHKYKIDTAATLLANPLNSINKK